jgi:hypothetical protein
MKVEESTLHLYCGRQVGATIRSWRARRTLWMTSPAVSNGPLAPSCSSRHGQDVADGNQL